MKKLFPLLIAGLVFLVALGLSQPEKQTEVVVAAIDLPARHTIAEGDVMIKSLPVSSVPQDAFRKPEALYGQTLRFDRLAGDIILPSHLGGQQIELQPNERAVALRVNDSAGLSGLIQPGDLVGITAVLRSVNGTYSKYVAGGLRVLFITPEFRLNQPQNTVPQGTPQAGGGLVTAPGMEGGRAQEGVVVLAVPVQTQVLIYDFPLPDGTLLSEQRYVNLIDLLPALDQAQDVELSLVLESPAAADFTSPGIFLPELALTPQPTPTPDLTATAQYTPGVEETSQATATPEPPQQQLPVIPTPTPFGR
ncbi:MAG: Flp pilus assembly protein CpaB [Anaerolineales bacterium]